MPDLSRLALPGVCVALLLWAGVAQAEQKPRWEIGLGFAAVSLPDYRGSDETQNYLLPFPYFAYRFDWLKADRSGVRARVIESDRAELNLSLGATPPVKSKGNRAREGMPDLKPMLELGPSLDLTLWRSADHGTRLDLRLPVRAAIEARSDAKFAGWLFSPRLNLDLPNLDQPGGWRLGLVTGPTFADRRQNTYFYGVSGDYARPDRAAYSASGGYTGWQFLAALSRKYGKTWVGAYARWDTLRGAVFEESPLVRRQSYFTTGLGMTWAFAESAERIEVGED